MVSNKKFFFVGILSYGDEEEADLEPRTYSFKRPRAATVRWSQEDTVKLTTDFSAHMDEQCKTFPCEYIIKLICSVIFSLLSSACNVCQYLSFNGF